MLPEVNRDNCSLWILIQIKLNKLYLQFLRQVGAQLTLTRTHSRQRMKQSTWLGRSIRCRTCIHQARNLEGDKLMNSLYQSMLSKLLYLKLSITHWLQIAGNLKIQIFSNQRVKERQLQVQLIDNCAFYHLVLSSNTAGEATLEIALLMAVVASRLAVTVSLSRSGTIGASLWCKRQNT